MGLWSAGAGAIAGSLNGAASVTFLAIENIARKHQSASGLPAHLFNSIPRVSVQHALQMSRLRAMLGVAMIHQPAVMFCAYETSKSSALAALDPAISRAHESAQLFTGTGFAAICTGGAVAGTAYTLAGAVLEQLPALTRQASSALHGLLGGADFRSTVHAEEPAAVAAGAAGHAASADLRLRRL